MLRIIAGIYKGRKIDVPDLKITRPTTDKVREAIFSSIQFKIPNSICLDLFSGSGALSIEAISRGAMKVISSENNAKIFKILKSNVDKLDIKNIELHNKDALSVIKIKNNTEYNFVFLDPPYDSFELLNECIEQIYKSKMLAKEGMIIVETNDLDKITLPKDLMIYKTKAYGKTQIAYIVHI